MFWFFGLKVCGILAPQPGIEPTASALEGKVLTTGPPVKSLCWVFTVCSSLHILLKTYYLILILHELMYLILITSIILILQMRKLKPQEAE